MFIVTDLVSLTKQTNKLSVKIKSVHNEIFVFDESKM